MTVSVEAYSGAFAIFEMHPYLLDSPPPGDHFPPRIPESEAVETGRRELQHTILRLRSMGGKPVVGEAQRVELLQYPFWVYYYERRRGLLDIKLLDAVTGGKGGAKTKVGVLEAFKLREAEERTHGNTSYPT